ncbi:MAG: MarR family transcriptional regulator [Tomitella sp.]|nr:MarR family transcriptional regulator [Tomitella sp.]
MAGEGSESEDTLALAAGLRVAVSRLSRRLREQFRAGQFTPSHRAALGRIERAGPMTLTALARAEGIRPQSMGAIVDVLVTSGFVVAERDPADGRRRNLSLTRSGREWIRETRIRRDDWLYAALADTLTAEEQRRLAECLPLLERLVETPIADERR